MKERSSGDFIHFPLKRIADIVDASGISRTHAITLFPDWCDHQELSEIDSDIQKGGLIGKTFRDHGYTIRKHVAGVYIVALPAWLKERFQTTASYAKARTSEFYARKEDEEPKIYGYVTEIYTPDFRPADINDVDQAQISATTDALEALGVDRDIIWKSIVHESTIPLDIVQRAQQASVQRALENQKYIKTYLRTANT